MKNPMGVLFAVLVMSCFLLLGPSPVRAECTTQGALASGLAEMLKLNVATPEAAAAALAALDIAPDGGWLPGECLTPEVAAQVKAAYDAAVSGGRAANLVPGAVDAVLESLQTVDRQYNVISPVSPVQL